MTAVTLGLDIGTYESKGVLVDAEGSVVAQASRPHRMHVPQPGWAEHVPDQDWWGDLVHIARALVAEAPDARIAGVALSAIGPCCLPVDADGQALMNGILYGVDTRAVAEIAALNAEIGEEAILAEGANALTTQSVGPKILWVRRNRPDIWARTAHMVTSTTYLVRRLTGEMVIDHYTAANFTPLYDRARRDWADRPDICPRGRLPRLLWSTEIAGTVTPEAAAATGLPAGIPVTCGTIDAAAEAVSVGVTSPGDMMVMYGSTIFMIEVTDRVIRDARMWSAPWLFPDREALMAGLATSGTLTHWFRDHFARDLPRETAFATLAAEAGATPKGARGLLCLPYFSGERTPIQDPKAKGAFFGLDLTHGRGEMMRAVLEGIASGTAHVLETCAELGATPRRLRAVGGGTQNAVWMQATSDLAGLPQEVCATTRGASYGDAFLAHLALGHVAEGDIAAWNSVARTVAPEDVPVYRRQYPLWKRLYLQTRDIAHGLGAAP